MNLKLVLLVLFSSIFFVGCTKTELIRPAERNSAAAVSLPYTFNADGIDVHVVSFELTKKASAWNTTLTTTLAPNETWLVLSATVYEKDGQDKEMKMSWRSFIHVLNQSGVNLSPVNLLRRRLITYVPDQYKLRGNEREDLKICFHLKREDFPIKLLFVDGKTTGAIIQP